MPRPYKSFHRLMKRLSTVDRDSEFSIRKVHVEPQLPPLLRRKSSALRHVDPHPGPDEVRFHFLGEPSTLSKALSHEQKVIEVGE
jgi:hypothetical protein